MNNIVDLEEKRIEMEAKSMVMVAIGKGTKKDYERLDAGMERINKMKELLSTV